MAWLYVSLCLLKRFKVLFLLDMDPMDPFTFISAMMTLMATDAHSAMSLMMLMSGGQLPENVADVTNMPSMRDAKRSSKKRRKQKEEPVEGPQLPPGGLPGAVPPMMMGLPPPGMMAMPPPPPPAMFKIPPPSLLARRKQPLSTQVLSSTNVQPGASKTYGHFFLLKIRSNDDTFLRHPSTLRRERSYVHTMGRPRGTTRLDNNETA